VRRLKRLPRLTLSLAGILRKNTDRKYQVSAIFFGTGMGALSETHAFLTRLFKSEGKFSSPTDFVGSLHNFPAGQLALAWECSGPNVTATGTDDSFEQALFMAGLITGPEDEPVLCVAADEGHEELTPLLDPSAAVADCLSDGGAAFLLEPGTKKGVPRLLPVYSGFESKTETGAEKLVDDLFNSGWETEHFGAIFAGIPKAHKQTGWNRLEKFLQYSGFSGPVVDYRRVLGEHPAISAVACALACKWVGQDYVPGALISGSDISLNGSAILLLTLGPKLNAVVVF